MKMSKKKLGCLILAGAMMASVFAGCSNGTSSGSQSGNSAATGGTVTVKFWSAPQKVQYAFWSAKAKAFNATKATVNGKTITVTVQQMPESPSSEAGIQNAIVTGTIPAASENISRSFASTLATSGAVYDLQDEQWFKDAVATKQIEKTIAGWAINSKQYVLPEYVNPMTWQWNAKALKALGITKVPQTVDDLDAVLKAFTENKSKMSAIGVTHTLYRPALLHPEQWWERWFDFQGPYMALSQKTSWVDDGKLTLDRQGAIDTFELLGKFGNTIQTNEVTDLWTAKNPSILLSVSSPWDIQTLSEAGKTYGLDGDYVFGPSLVKKSGDKAYNFGDSKGIVLYKNSSVSDDQHQGVIEFLKWVYGKDNCTQTDADWLKATTMLPVRGDIATNSAFADQLKKYPELKDLVEYSAYSVPCMASDKMTDIQTALTESGLTPYIQEALKQKPLNAPDASKSVDSAFSAMKSAGGLS
ncbi:MAG: carbohydrate ABC transporter substrate-binding protein [Clostridiales bacterium]|nr:carbohydrate ABC transporter substrate-binding protein [Clostridiales bacterium]